MYSYFVGLGSNINPSLNVTLMLQELLHIFGRVDVSRIIETEPVGFESHNTFLNLSVRIKTEKNPLQLKECFNAIETQLGRDKTQSTGHQKLFQDRVADLDILFAINETEHFVDENLLLATEIFIRPILIELMQSLGFECHVPMEPLSEGIEMTINNVLIGKKPVTLYKKTVLLD